MKHKEKTLTRAEFQLMNILWDINHSTSVWDILERYDEPRPAYTTVATNLKVLYEKGYVDYFKLPGKGKAHLYVARVQRAEYTRRAMQEVKRDLFGGSLRSMFSYFIQEEELEPEELEALLAQVLRDKTE